MNGNIWSVPVYPDIKIVIEQKLSTTVDDIATDVVEFNQILKEEMIADLRYFNSFKKEVESLQSQLELKQTQFSNENDRLLREYFYVDHMNAILGFYTDIDEYSDMACNYLEALKKCECPKTQLLKRTQNVKNISFNELSKRFSELELHCISLELSLQQSQEKIKNEKLWKMHDTPLVFDLNNKIF
ncbi:hypothetical protein Tco_0505519 [Tanacetum coccineum]